MRDPRRITQVLEALQKVWSMAPDLRLGQLLLIATPPGKDPFYFEDDDFLFALRKMGEELSSNQKGTRIRPTGFDEPADYARTYSAMNGAPLETLLRRREMYAEGDQVRRAIDDLIKIRMESDGH